MSGLGSTPEEILRKSLNLIELQVARSRQEPVGVLTATEVLSLDRATRRKVVDHVRLFGTESVKLVGLSHLHHCKSANEEDRYFLGNILICSVQRTGSGFEYFVLHNEVPKATYDEFLLATKRLVKKRERAQKNVEVDLTDIEKEMNARRKEIEDSALKKVDALLDDAVGELVGYVKRVSQLGSEKETPIYTEDDTATARKAVRAGAKPIFDSELQKVSERSKSGSEEHHYIGSSLICSKIFQRGCSKEKSKQYLIFEERVPLRDYDRFLHKLRNLVKEKRVTISEEEGPKKVTETPVVPESQDGSGPVFGFQTGDYTGRK